jgi:DNA-binding transcriptional MerR regulator
VRIAELSRVTGVPVPRIKYYIREGLVDHGERTQANQAEYEERHVRRVRLVRALVTIGGLSIAETRDVLTHLDQPKSSLQSVLGEAMAAIGVPKPLRDDERGRQAYDLLSGLAERRCWHFHSENPAAASVVEAIAVLYDLGLEHLVDRIDVYAEAAERVAAADLEMIGRLGESDAIVESAVVGTVLGGVILDGLRRLAQADASGRRFPREMA